MGFSYAAYSMIGFGSTAFISGLFTLVNPTSFLTFFDIPSGSEGSVRGNALAAIAVGIYYTLWSVQENKLAFVASIPMRLLTATVFGLQGGMWIVPGIWEGTGAVLTAIALLVDNRHRKALKKD